MIPPKPRPPVELTLRSLKVVSSPPDGFHPAVVVGVTTRDEAPEQIRRCLASVARQLPSTADLGLVILLDVAGRELPPLPRVEATLAPRCWIVAARCGNAARARNAVLHFVDAHIPSARWVARMDADDRFATSKSLAAARALGEREGAVFVLGGNDVVGPDGRRIRSNAATPELLCPEHVVRIADRMAGEAEDNELPSCNLLLATQSGLRYPELSSAEDHWLVAELLIHRRDGGAILTKPKFAEYTLHGPTSRRERAAGRHKRARRALARAIRCWTTALAAPGGVLGWGNEGVVRRLGQRVLKHFYPGALGESDVVALRPLLVGASPHVPAACFRRVENAQWVAEYPFEETLPAERVTRAQVEDFLVACLERRFVAANVKRSNFRVTASGALQYIDVGKWIIPMHASYFLDAATRMYSIFVLGLPDDELLRRPSLGRAPKAWGTLPGFGAFYGSLLTRYATSHWNEAGIAWPPGRVSHSDVTLMIKACGMDAAYASRQIRHVVDQLSGPAEFAERVVVIDPFEGPFTRQHRRGDVALLRKRCAALVQRGWLDRLLTAPLDPKTVARINGDWFGLPCDEARTAEGVPVAPQLWAFEQVRTRYVLQADLDVLIGRRDPSHDVVADMVGACAPSDVLGVAFNIAHDATTGWRDYFAEPGQFVPEVRLGLLDLDRLRGCRPLPNEVVDGRLTRTWYRSAEEAQRQTGMRTLRGGDSRTFYVHPPNKLKACTADYHRVRDLVSQGRVPAAQLGRWDLEVPPSAWSYAPRTEHVVVYASGRATSEEKLVRFMRGLRIQQDQTFGVVLLDDDSRGSTRPLQDLSAWLGDRATLIRTGTHRGRMANLVRVLRTVCSNPETLVAIVDLDDALFDPQATATLRSLRLAGHDMVLAAPFRPDVPTRLYEPDFLAARSKYGGDVWMHLRAFRRGLFDTLADELLQDAAGRWLSECTDYATMVPMSEQALSPIYVPRYMYWHERATKFETEASRRRRDALILNLLARQPIAPMGKPGTANEDGSALAAGTRATRRVVP